MTLQLGLLFLRRVGVDGECVHAALQLARQCGVDHAVTLDPALPPEGLSHNINPEMRLPARPMAGVAFMLVGFIDDAQARRRESPGQLLRDDVGYAHGLGVSPTPRERSIAVRVGRPSFCFVKLAAAPSASA